jgi:hypothetical protein
MWPFSRKKNKDSSKTSIETDPQVLKLRYINEKMKDKEYFIFDGCNLKMRNDKLFKRTPFEAEVYEREFLYDSDCKETVTRSIKQRYEKHKFEYTIEYYSSSNPDYILGEINEKTKFFLKEYDNLIDILSKDDGKTYNPTLIFSFRHIALFTKVQPKDVEKYVAHLTVLGETHYLDEFRKYLIQRLSDHIMSCKTYKDGTRKTVLSPTYKVQYDDPTVNVMSYYEWTVMHEEQLRRDRLNEDNKATINEILAEVQRKIDARNSEN